jgi:threonine/homoserine/homoserine lactone efflux protein
MQLDQFLAFVLVDLLLIFTPGADWAYAIAVGARRGPVAAAVGGLVAGYTAHAVLVVVGVGALLAESDTALKALTVAGALYLVWLGIGVLRQPPTPTDAGGQTSEAWPAARRGAAISGLNPKGLLLYFAVLPQFIDRSQSWPVIVQLAVLAAVHIIGCAVVYAAVGTGARALLSARPVAARRAVRVSGVVMLLVAGALLVEAVTA